MRYSAAEVELAEVEGRRVRPQRIRPATENPCSRGRCGDFEMINGVYAAAQSSVRTAERAALGELRKLANGGAGAADGADFDERANGRRAAW
ncbi:hypothetical protein [Catenulispora pinisilvae]|uniref:hypothetical protein n=1 Tax=Catenulispora pinisilvae TaxID=2705253 RepID=UPI0018914945|nr:hypothetical protein [Catenulispora pinisilvae]